MRSIVSFVFVVAPFAWGCRDDKPAPKSPLDAGVAATASVTSAVASSSAPPRPSTSAPAPVASALASFDAGALACKQQIAPQLLHWVGPAALVPGDTLTLVANKQGVPDTRSLPVAPVASAPLAIPALDPQPARYGANANACAVAGKYVYCMDREGAVRRSSLDGKGAKVVARAKPGTRISAAALGADHSLLGYLDERKTSEGVVWEAYVVGDEGPDVQRLSEDGSGATFVDLAPRGEDVLAMLVDARSALTPVHARAITWDKDKPKIGADAVVFVGGPPERRTSGALATGDGKTPSFSLLPLANDDGFGLGVIKIDKVPAVDSPVLWSKYPNGLDPASVAATRGVTPIRVARVRPADASPTAQRVLELGRLDADGRFTSHGAIAEAKTILDLAIAADKYGAVWVYYTLPDQSVVQRLACP